MKPYTQRSELNLKRATLYNKDYVRKKFKEVGFEIAMNKVESEVCSFYYLKPFQLQIITKKREIVLARQICHKISKVLLPSVSNERIGKRFGDLDHATVGHSISQIENLIEYDKKFAEDYKKIEERILA